MVAGHAPRIRLIGNRRRGTPVPPPADGGPGATHKAGWLPPNCCANDHRLIIDAGGIALPSGDWFGIAAVADGGQDYNLSVRWVAYAACRVYVMLARDDDHSCKRARDGPT